MLPPKMCDSIHERLARTKNLRVVVPRVGFRRVGLRPSCAYLSRAARWCERSEA